MYLVIHPLTPVSQPGPQDIQVSIYTEMTSVELKTHKITSQFNNMLSNIIGNNSTQIHKFNISAFHRNNKHEIN